MRLALGILGAAIDLLEIGLERAAELGEVRVGALAVEQRPAKLLLELLDGAGQRGLRDVAALGRAREIQLLAEREEVADLMHFHWCAGPGSPTVFTTGGGTRRNQLASTLSWHALAKP